MPTPTSACFDTRRLYQCNLYGGGSSDYACYLVAPQESRKRKQAHKGAEAPPLVEAELAATELRRWPDYAFLMMADETGRRVPSC